MEFEGEKIILQQICLIWIHYKERKINGALKKDKRKELGKRR